MFSELLKFLPCHYTFYYRKWKRQQNLLSWWKIIREHVEVTNSVYCKPTSSGIYTNFNCFLPSTYRVDMTPTLLYRFFCIYSDWSKFHMELVKLMDVFKNNIYPENFINNCFKTFFDQKHWIQEKLVTATKKFLFLVFSHTGSLSLRTRTKLKKSLKDTLNRCNLQIVFKNKNNLLNTFCFEDYSPKVLAYGIICKFLWGLLCKTPLCNDWGTYQNLISKKKKKKNLSLRVVLLTITSYFVTIYHLLIVLVC